MIVTAFYGLAALSYHASAQTCSVEKPTFSRDSPNGLFNVQMPTTLRKDATSYPETILYGAKLGDCVFLVYIIRHPGDHGRSFSDKMDGLEFMLGGDDDHEFSEQPLKVGSYRAKKILYSKQNIQGLLIDAGDYTFVVGFTSKNRKDLSGKVSKRFFSSFRVARRIIDI